MQNIEHFTEWSFLKKMNLIQISLTAFNLRALDEIRINALKGKED